MEQGVTIYRETPSRTQGGIEVCGTRGTVGSSSITEVALDVFYTRAWSVATPIATCRASWLQYSVIPKEVQGAIEDLGFEVCDCSTQELRKP